MKLRCTVGPYAGQVLDYPQHVGEALLATGQAEKPEPEAAAPAAPETMTRPAPKTRPARAKKATKKRSKKKRGS